jgi:hypothetical protein
MEKARKTLVLSVILVFVLSSLAFALEQPVYPIKGKHKGGDVTPKQAYEMMKKDPKNTFLVDVRTRYEY